MARKSVTDMSTWPSLTLEGNLIAPAMVATIASPKDDEETRQNYRIRKGLSIRDEISTAFRVGQSHFDLFARLENPSAEATRRFMRDFLAETLGFDDLEQASDAISFIAGDRVPVVIVPPSDEKLDRRSPTLSIGRSRSAAFALQDYLNDHDEILWGLVTNGTVIRLMRDNASLTRPAYIEADLRQIFANEDAASFSVLWLLFHRTRFGNQGAPATDCSLERWRDLGSREGVTARDKLAGQVQNALELLGSGFLEANPGMADKLRSGEINLTEWFNELLRLVYRLIFLMVAEDRNLLHSPRASTQTRKLYSEGYSLTALRTQCIRNASWNRHHDRYEGIKIVFHALANGQPALALPALGGLFTENKLPHLGVAKLRNRAFMEALYRLSWLSDKSSMVPVNWRAMETEELGSVYESLLELQPQLADNGHRLAFAEDTTEKKGNQRKTTGSYYTPDSLVQALLDTALDPVLDQTETQAENPEKALLKLSIIDPACGSGHFLLAAARRIATRLARIRAEGTPSLEDFRHALRDVTRCCIHGVDRNPMAVELTKVALWIETVDPGMPLGFFDAQIRCGDALLGIFDLKVLKEGIPDAAYKPLTGDDKAIAKHYLQINKDAQKGQGLLNVGGTGWQMPSARPIAVEFADLRELPEETVEQIRAKSKRFKELQKAEEYRRANMAADLYITAFLLPKTGDAPIDGSPRTVPTTDEVWVALNQGYVVEAMQQAPDVARRARAFHWPLEFPDIMQRGGFDVVLGNPPWEVMQLSDEEHFASRRPEIAALVGAARKRAIDSLSITDPNAYQEFAIAKRSFDASNQFARGSGRFELTAKGKINTYALFAELFANLAKRRAGVIVQTGIATDATTAPFFASLVENKRLAQFIDFENREKLFEDVDSRMKFCLMTLGQDEAEANFAFFLTNPAQLAESERNFTLSPDQIARLNPNTRTAPVFRSRADAELTAKIYANAPILIDENKGKEGNPWHVEFRQGLFNMTSDSNLFLTASQLEEAGWQRDGTDWIKGNERYLPLYEAKMIHHFDHRWAGYDEAGEKSSDLDLSQKQNPDAEPAPRYWVPKAEVDSRLAAKGWSCDWLMGWRDITNATNERTVIFSMIPRHAVGHTMPLMFPEASPKLWACLLANLNSLILDYCARQSVGGTHLTYGYLKQFTILQPTFYSESHINFIIPRVLELIYTSHSMASFARDLGYDGPPFAWDEDRRAILRAELDAFYARAYGLNRDDLRYILDPTDVKGPDYPSETFRVLKDKEIRQYREYRTRRLVLDAWDRMEASGEFAALGMRSGIHTEESAIHVNPPVLASLKDTHWSWPSQISQQDRLRYAAQYALGISVPSQDAMHLRVLIACLADPALLTQQLSGEEQKHWIRLMGQEAQLRANNVIRMQPKINAAWRSAFQTLITSGQLEERQDGGWVRGKYFNTTILRSDSEHAQRTAFALQVIRRFDHSQIRTFIAQEDNFIWERLRDDAA